MIGLVGGAARPGCCAFGGLWLIAHAVRRDARWSRTWTGRCWPPTFALGARRQPARRPAADLARLPGHARPAAQDRSKETLMEIRPILSALLRNKTGALLVARAGRAQPGHRLPTRCSSSSDRAGASRRGRAASPTRATLFQRRTRPTATGEHRGQIAPQQQRDLRGAARHARRRLGGLDQPDAAVALAAGARASSIEPRPAANRRRHRAVLQPATRCVEDASA